MWNWEPLSKITNGPEWRTRVLVHARIHPCTCTRRQMALVWDLCSSKKRTVVGKSDGFFNVGLEPRGWRARKRSWWKCTHYQSSIFMKVSWHRRRCRRMTKQNPGGPRLCKEKCTYCPSDRVSHFELTWVVSWIRFD